jgi:hypothetical protein
MDLGYGVTRHERHPPSRGRRSRLSRSLGGILVAFVRPVVRPPASASAPCNGRASSVLVDFGRAREQRLHALRPTSGSAHRIPASNAPVDQGRHGGVVAGPAGRFRHFGTGGSRVFKDPDTLMLRQDLPAVQREQRRLRDRERGISRYIWARVIGTNLSMTCHRPVGRTNGVIRVLILAGKARTVLTQIRMQRILVDKVLTHAMGADQNANTKGGAGRRMRTRLC